MAGIENYVKLFSDEGFHISFLFNLKLGVFTIIGSNLVSFVLAYFLNKNIRAKGLSRALFFIPNIISAVLVAFIWTFIFSQILPNLAETMHWDWLGSISWFGSPGTATFTIILVSVWQQIGFLMMIYVIFCMMMIPYTGGSDRGGKDRRLYGLSPDPRYPASAFDADHHDQPVCVDFRRI